MGKEAPSPRPPLPHPIARRGRGRGARGRAPHDVLSDTTTQAARQRLESQAYLSGTRTAPPEPVSDPGMEGPTGNDRERARQPVRPRPSSQSGPEPVAG